MRKFIGWWMVAVIWATLAGLGPLAHARTYDRLFSGEFEILDRRVEVTPGSAILIGSGQSVTLAAQVLDADGNETGAPIEWGSSNPNHISVSDAGLIMSHIAVGSSVITARSAGAVPAAVLVAAATPVPGAVILSDADIEGSAIPLDAAETYGVGFRYEVTLVGAAPLLDEVLINTGEKPVAGRVVAVDASGAQPVVTLETLPLSELFSELEIRETLLASELGRVEVEEAFSDYTVQRSPSGRITLLPPVEKTKAIGPVGECETPDLSQVFNFGFSQSGDPLYVNPDLDLIYEYTSANGLERLELAGSMQTVLDINLSLEAQVAATVSCRIDIVTLVIPFSGPLGLILSPRIPLGVGFDLSGKVTDSVLRHNMTLASRLDVSGGIACDPECAAIGDISATSQYVERVLVEGDSDPTIGQFQVELAAFAYAFANLALGPIIPALDIEFELITAKGGNEQTINLRSANAQVLDPGYAANFALSTKWTLALGSSIQGLLDLLSINQLGDFALTYQDVLATSPAGTMTINGGGAGSNPILETGETVTVTVNLNPVRFLGVGSVVGVDLYRRVDDGQGGFDLVPNRPGCSTILSANAQQTQFTCQASYAEEHLGSQTLVAFVRAKLFGFEVPIPLEIAANSSLQFTVVEPDPDDDDEDLGANVEADFEMIGQIAFIDLSNGGGPLADATFRDDDEQYSDEDETSFSGSMMLSDSGTRDGSSGSASLEANLVATSSFNDSSLTSFEISADFDLRTTLTQGSDKPIGTFSELQMIVCVSFESAGGAMTLAASYEGDDGDPQTFGQPFLVELEYRDPVTGEDVELVDEDLFADQPLSRSLAAPAGAEVYLCVDAFQIYVESARNFRPSPVPSQMQGSVTVRLSGG